MNVHRFILLLRPASETSHCQARAGALTWPTEREGGRGEGEEPGTGKERERRGEEKKEEKRRETRG